MKKLGHYDLLGVLGAGAMGTVHRARDGASGREVALKVVRAGDEQRAKRLVREAELASRLDHPGIVRVLGVGRDFGFVFVAFELVEAARPLRDVLPTLTRRQRVLLVRDVARALGHAHARGVVHRDVKAENVLVDAAGVARVTDFGIGTAEDLDRLTHSGTILGTPRCMAPEQAIGARERIGPATDVWALGIVLHEGLVGEHPLFGEEEPESLVDAIKEIVTKAPRRLRDVDATISPALDAVVRRALQKEPGERFPDGEAMARALDEALAARVAHRRRGPLAALSLLAALVVVSAVAVANRQAGTAERATPTITGTEAGDVTGLAPAFDQALERDEAQALVARARARADATPEAAAADLAAALRLDPGADVRLAALDVAYAHRALDDEASLREGLALAPGDVAAEAWLTLADHIEHRAPARARAARERALELAGSPVMRGEVLVRLGRRQAAADVLRPLADDPLVGARARLWLACIAHESGNAVQAEFTPEERLAVVKLYDEVIAADPSFFVAWQRRGLIRGELGDPGAAADVERACALAPRGMEAATWQLAGYVSIRLGRWDDAVRALDRSLALDPASVEARKQRGIARRRAGDLRGAVDDLELAVADPAGEQQEVLHGLIEARVAVGEPTGVPGLVARLRRRAPSLNLDVWCAGMLIEAGDLPGAVELLEPLVSETAPASVRAFACFLRCRARLDGGDASGALADARLVVELAPASSRAHVAVALACLALGDTAGAGAALERAVPLQSNDEDVLWLRLGEAWWLQATGGDLERALANLERVLAGPEPPWALALAVRVLVRLERGDADGARADARALLARAAEAPATAWTVRVARAALGPTSGSGEAPR